MVTFKLHTLSGRISTFSRTSKFQHGRTNCGRWSTDTFVTSHIVRATGSGINYSATIPGQPSGIAVQYSLLTSTTNLSSAVYSGVIDPLALSVSMNFKYVVRGSP